MFKRRRSLKEILTNSRKTFERDINTEEAINILQNFKDNETKKGFNYVYLEGLCSEIIGKNKHYEFHKPQNEVINYIKENFPTSEGKYKVFYHKKKEINKHKIKLKKEERLKGHSYLKINFLEDSV